MHHSSTKLSVVTVHVAKKLTNRSWRRQCLLGCHSRVLTLLCETQQKRCGSYLPFPYSHTSPMAFILFHSPKFYSDHSGCTNGSCFIYIKHSASVCLLYCIASHPSCRVLGCFSIKHEDPKTRKLAS